MSYYLSEYYKVFYEMACTSFDDRFVTRPRICIKVNDNQNDLKL